jgi:hypothetical protein
MPYNLADMNRSADAYKPIELNAILRRCLIMG